MDVDLIINKSTEYAFKEFEKAGKDIYRLPDPLKIVVIICSAQGIIDNGGFEYFFESDFPDNPPYSMFSDAYREIGAKEDAEYLDKAVSMFPFQEPHLHQDKRNSFMKENAYDESKEFTQLGNRICLKYSIWEKLAAYVLNNEKYFPVIK